jgi:hypothetical protein
MFLDEILNQCNYNFIYDCYQILILQLKTPKAETRNRLEKFKYIHNPQVL